MHFRTEVDLTAIARKKTKDEIQTVCWDMHHCGLNYPLKGGNALNLLWVQKILMSTLMFATATFCACIRIAVQQKRKDGMNLLYNST